jgi:plasmid stabilization system protein ParE
VEKEETDQFEVLVTRNAEIHFYELAEYLYEHMTLDRAEKITSELHEAALSLKKLYNRGAIEENLRKEKQEFRYILFKRTPRTQIKIIYFIDKATKTVFVTDFFPTEKDPKKLRKRSK